MIKCTAERDFVQVRALTPSQSIVPVLLYVGNNVAAGPFLLSSSIRCGGRSISCGCEDIELLLLLRLDMIVGWPIDPSI
jgi:hypothetical protein